MKSVIISGGGTGGHIFPALAIAQVIRKHHPDCAIHFVGAEGRMEMQKVPEAGFPITGLPIAGLQRSLSLKNFLLPIKIWKSLRMAKALMREKKPDIVIGVGGYASAPTLWAAQQLGIPTLIQEQNSYAGLTNKLLAKKAKRICVAYEGMEQFFPKEKLVLTGNPVRPFLTQALPSISNARHYFGLSENKKTILFIGGSLGARTINHSVAEGLKSLLEKDLQVIWQTGKGYSAQAKELCAAETNVFTADFIREMDMAYAAADIIVSRAGALSVSELCIVGKAAILVPSPNVAEDHQTKNALALSEKSAAILVKDSEANHALIPAILSLANDVTQRGSLAAHLSELSIKDADERIYQCILSVIKPS